MKTIFKILISLFLIVQQTAAIAQDAAALLPNAKQTFLDNNGNPLSSGRVYFYTPNTSTLKTTWQDADKTTANSNPVVLDAAGRAIIYGDGEYRQVVRDRNGNLIWDQVTTSTGTGGGTPSTGDGDLVGTIKPWAGLIAPNQYLFAYGQEIVRVTYPELYTAITLSTSVFCTASSPTLTGIGDTTQIPVGSVVEASCVAAGSTVLSKTASTVTLNNNASITTSLIARFFPWGNGNGTSTFNLPDLRGKVLAGRNNMGGIPSSNLTTTYYLTNPDALGASGGNQNITITTDQIPSHNHGVTDPGHAHQERGGGGSGAENIMLSAGTGTTAGGNVTTVNTTSTSPTNISIQNTGGGQPFSLIQPTITTNYIIKVTPDTNSAEATGVLSLGGMTGVIACGSGLLCTGNVISAADFDGYVATVSSTSEMQALDFTSIVGNQLTAAGSGGLFRWSNTNLVSQVTNDNNAGNGFYPNYVAPASDTTGASGAWIRATTPTPSLGNLTPVRQATTANITLSGSQSVDGINTVTGGRVLVKDQTTASENGIYTSGSGAWVRSVDFSDTGQIGRGMMVHVYAGDVNANTHWRINNSGITTIGSSNISFVGFAAVTYEPSNVNVYWRPNSATTLTGDTSFWNIILAPGIGTTSGIFQRNTIIGVHAADMMEDMERCEAIGQGAMRYGRYCERSTAVGNISMEWIGQDLTSDPAGEYYQSALIFNGGLPITNTTGIDPDGGSITAAGTLYTTGTYTAVPVTGGTGSGAQATVIISGGGVTSFTITAFGTGYSNGDVLSVNNANVGGTGSGFTWTLAKAGWNRHGLETDNPGIRATLAAFSNWASDPDEVAFNVGLGRDALNNFVKGINNTCIGYSSCGSSYVMDDTVAVGMQALDNGIFANSSVAVGYRAGYNMQEGVGSTLVGRAAGFSLLGKIGSDYNTILGANAGLSSGGVLWDGYGNIWLGAKAGQNSSGIISAGTLNQRFIAQSVDVSGVPLSPLMYGHLGTGDLCIGICDFATLPKGRVHIRSANSSATPPTQGDELVIEHSGSTSMGQTFLCGTTCVQTIYFGSNATSNAQGALAYLHATEEFRIRTNTTDRFFIKTGLYADGVAGLDKGAGSGNFVTLFVSNIAVAIVSAPTIETPNFVTSYAVDSVTQLKKVITCNTTTNFASIASGAFELAAPVACSGVLESDILMVSVDDTDGGLKYNAIITTADEIAVYAQNFVSVAINPPSRNVSVSVYR